MTRDGAVWKLVGLITRRSQVQILLPQFFMPIFKADGLMRHHLAIFSCQVVSFYCIANQ